MAITVSTSPPSLCMSKNQIPLRLNAPDALATPAALGVYEFTMQLPDTIGDALNVTWSYAGVDYDVTFTIAAATDVDEREVEISDAITVTAYREWISTVLIPALQTDADLNQFFSIALYELSTLSGLRFTARSPYFGNLDFDAAGTGFTVANKTFAEGTAPLEATNYAARILLSIAPTATSTPEQYVRLPEFQAFPNASGSIEIDLQPLVEPYFRDTELPELDESIAFRRMARQPRKLLIQYGQQSGDPLERSAVKSLSEISILMGGMNNADWTLRRSNLATYLEDSSSVVKFMTNRKRRNIYPGEPLHLHFYKRIAAASDYSLRAVYRKDGASSTVTEITDTGSTAITTGRVINFSPALDKLNAAALDGASAVSLFLVTTTSGIVVRSEIITLYPQPRPTGLTILEYQNPWGVADTISLPWTRQRIAEVEKLYYERDLGINYTAAQSSRRIGYSEMIIESLTLSIDNPSEHDGPWLAELLASPEVYLIVGGTTRVPVRVEQGSMNLERQGRMGQQFNAPKLVLTLDRAMAFSRMINLTDLCT